MDLETKIDLDTVDIQLPILCIPRASNNITQDTVKAWIKSLNFGTINKIKIISKLQKNHGSYNTWSENSGDKYTRIIITLKEWNRTLEVDNYRKRIMANLSVYYVPDDENLDIVVKITEYNSHQSTQWSPSLRSDTITPPLISTKPDRYIIPSRRVKAQ